MSQDLLAIKNILNLNGSLELGIEEEDINTAYKYSPVEAKAALYGSSEAKEYTKLDATKILFNNALGIPNEPTNLENKERSVLDKTQEKSERFSGGQDTEGNGLSLYGIPYKYLDPQAKLVAIDNQKQEQAAASQENQERTNYDHLLSDEQTETFLGGALNTVLGFGAATLKALVTTAELPFYATKIDSSLGVTDKDLSNYESVASKIAGDKELTLKEAKFKNSDKFAAITQANESDKIIKIMDSFADKLSEVYNPVKLDKLTSSERDIAAETVQDYQENGLPSSIGTFLSKTAKLAVEDPSATGELIAQVLPQMYLLAKFTGTSVAALTAEGTDKSIDEFVKEYGRQPDNTEKVIAGSLSLVSAGLDAFGAKVVLGAKRLLKASKKSDVDIPQATVYGVESALARASRKSVESAKKLLGTAPGRGVTGIGKAVLVEGSTEGAQNTLTQLAGKQDISKIDPVEVLTDTGLGAIAGGALKGGKPAVENVIAGVVTAGKGVKLAGKGVKASAKVTKKVVAPAVPSIKKYANKVADTIVSADGTAKGTDAVIEKSIKEETPETGIKAVLKQNFGKMTSERRKKSLNDLNELITNFAGQIDTVTATDAERIQLNERLDEYLDHRSRLVDASNKLKANPDSKTTAQLLDVLDNTKSTKQEKQSAASTLSNEVSISSDIPLTEVNRILGNDDFKKTATQKEIDVLEKYKIYKESIEKADVLNTEAKKDSTAVREDVLRGKGKFTGIQTYMQRMELAIALNDKAESTKVIKDLKKFRDSQIKKYQSKKFSGKNGESTRKLIFAEIKAIEAAFNQAASMGVNAFGAKKQTIKPKTIQAVQTNETKKEVETVTKKTSTKVQDKPDETKKVESEFKNYISELITAGKKLTSPKDIEANISNVAFIKYTGETLLKANPEVSLTDIQNINNIRSELAKDPGNIDLQTELATLTTLVVGKPVFSNTEQAKPTYDTSKDIISNGLTATHGNPNDRNTLATFLESNTETKKSSIFRNVSNVMSKLLDPETSVETKTKLKEMSEEQELALPHLLEFTKIFNNKFPSLVDFLTKEKIYPNNLDGSYVEPKYDKDGKLIPNTNSYGNPFGYLVQVVEDGTKYLNENIMSAISVASYNWLGTQGENTLFNDTKAIKAILKIKKDTDLPYGAGEEFQNSGVLKSALIENLGKGIVKQLGLKEVDNTDGNFLPRLEQAIGIMAVDTLLQLGYLEQTAKTSETMRSYFNSKVDPTELPNTFSTFVKLRKEAINPVKDIRINLKESDKLIEDIFDIESTVILPKFSKLKHINDKIKRSFMTVPKKAQGTLKTLQDVSWTARTEFNTLLNKLDKETLHVVLGVEDNLNKIHKTQEFSVISKNNSLTRSLELANDFIETMNEPNSKIYFEYEMWKNLRVGIKGIISPQASKLHRSMFVPSSTPVVVDSKELRDIFKLAVVQSFGGKIESQPIEVSYARFDELIQDEDVAKAIKAIKSGENLKNIQEAILMGGENTHTLEGLIALSKYSEDKSFITDLTIETDGITNGVAHGLIQSMINDSVYPMLEAAGVYTDGKTTDNTEWNSEPGNYDNYIQLARTWSKNLKQIIAGKGYTTREFNFLKRLTADLDDNIDGRKLSKSPLMTNVYGSSVKTIISILQEDAVKKFHTEMMATEDQEQLDELVADLNNLIGTKISSPPFDERRKYGLNEEKGEISKLNSYIESTYGAALEETLELRFANFNTFRKRINEASALMFEMFNLHYEKAIKEAEIKKDGKALTQNEKEELILDMMEKVPTIKTVFSNYSDDINERYLALDVSRVRDYSDWKKRVQVSHPETLANTKSGVQPDGTKSTLATFTESKYSVPISATPVSLIQSMDSANVLDIMDSYSALSVWDAVNYSLTDVVEGTELHNKSFIESHKDYSIMDSVTESLEAMLKDIYKDKVLYNKLTKIMKNDYKLNKYKTPGTLLTEIKFQGIKIQKGKKDFKPTAVSQFSFPEVGSHIITPVSESVDSQEEPITKAVSDVVNDVIKKSGDETFDFDNFVATQHFEVTHETTQRIFHELGKEGNVIDTAEHTQYLKDVLDNVVNKVIKPADEITLDLNQEKNHVLGAIKDNKIKIHAGKGVVGNLQQMSAQETLVHELIHRVTTHALSTNKKLRVRMEKLFQEVKKNTSYKDFLTYDSKGNLISSVNSNEEVEAAKARYDYIFNSSNYETVIKDNVIKKIYSSDYLYEFMAFGISNAKFREALNKVNAKSKVKIKEEDTWIEKLGKLFQKIMNWINGTMNKYRNKPDGVFADEKLTDLVNDLVGLNERTDKALFINKALNTFDGVRKLNQPLLNALDKVIFKPWEKGRVHLKNKDNKSGLEVATHTVLGIPHFFKTEDWVGRVTKITRNINLTENSFLIKILREGLAIDSENIIFHDLLRISKHVVDSARKHLANEVAIDVLSYFEERPTKHESDAITQVILQSNMTVLLKNYSVKEIQRLLINRTALNAAIKSTQDQLLQFGSNANYYGQQAESLGSIMVTSNALISDSKLNGHNIANMYGTELEVEGDVQIAEDIIKELASLWALSYSSDSKKQLVADIMKREYTRTGLNGIDNVFRNHDRLQKLAFKQLFNSNKTQMIDGFIFDINNPNVEIRVDFADPVREAELKREGFIRNDKTLIDDPTMTKSTKKLSTYVFKGGVINGHTKGVVSQTNKNLRGFAASDIFALNSPVGSKADALIEINNIKKKNKIAVKKQFNSMRIPKTNKPVNYMVPVFNDRGDITGYRYLMSDMTKNTLLERNNNFALIMGKMEANIKDKVNSAKVNKTALNAMYADAKEHYKKDPGAFVVISPRSSDKRLKEIAALMPKDMKRDLQVIWGGDTIIVREKYLDIIFGFKKLSITNLYGFKNLIENEQLNQIFNFPQVTKKVEDVWQYITSVIKNNIVIKSPVVVFNVISNNILLWSKGVPSKDIMPSQLDAINALNSYQKDFTLRNNLERKLENFPNLSPKVKKDTEAKIGQLTEKLNGNIVKDLVDEGIFQNIIEDIELDIEDSGFTIKDKILDKIEDAADKYINPNITNVYKQLYLTERTTSYRMLLKSTQFSDFVARYALYQHNRNTLKMSKEQALFDIVETFINYDVPTSPEMQYLNDMGVLMFTKFLFRIQRVIFKLFKENPVNAATVIGVQELLGDASDVMDSQIFLHGVNFRNPLLESPSDLAHVGAWEAITGLSP